MKDIKIFRDPIHNLISFDKIKEKVLIDIINTPEFQRLKRIRQLGFSWVTYPTAIHTRFSHSLGVCHLVGLIFDYLVKKDYFDIVDEDNKFKVTKDQLKLLLRITALLHDIGHGPFSHLYEKVNKKSHKLYSKEIILDSKRNIYKSIMLISKRILNTKLKKHFPKWISDILDKTFYISWINELLSSQVDLDRMDYLMRDAYMCGVKYARFDIEWILKNMSINIIPTERKREGLVINAQKGIHSLESFIISRFHMYERVYFHKTTRCFENLLLKLVERIRELIERKEIGKILFINDSWINNLNNPDNLDDYLKLDDFYILTQIKIWSDNCGDSILKELSNNIINRVPYKLFKEIVNDRIFNANDYGKISKLFKDKNIEHNYYYFEDDYKNNPYTDDYLLGKTTPEGSEHIWLLAENDKIAELSEKSDIIKSIKNKSLKKYRFYIKKEFFNELKKIIKPGGG